MSLSNKRDLVKEKIKREHKCGPVCNRCTNVLKLVDKMYDSSIPIGYWFLNMKDFQGAKTLKDAYDKYEDRGFQVLSIALGDKKVDIANFRRNHQPMPWLHAFHDWEDDAVAPFEVEAIPRAILVGADGLILASDADCRGDRLLETLERELGGGHD